MLFTQWFAKTSLKETVMPDTSQLFFPLSLAHIHNTPASARHEALEKQPPHTNRCVRSTA